MENPQKPTKLDGNDTTVNSEVVKKKMPTSSYYPFRNAYADCLGFSFLHGSCGIRQQVHKWPYLISVATVLQENSLWLS